VFSPLGGNRGGPPPPPNLWANGLGVGRRLGHFSPHFACTPPPPGAKNFTGFGGAVVRANQLPRLPPPTDCGGRFWLSIFCRGGDLTRAYVFLIGPNLWAPPGLLTTVGPSGPKPQSPRSTGTVFYTWWGTPWAPPPLCLAPPLKAMVGWECCCGVTPMFSLGAGPTFDTLEVRARWFAS